MSKSNLIFVLITSQNCGHCKQFLEQWSSIEKGIRQSFQGIKIVHLHIENSKEIVKINDTGKEIPLGTNNNVMIKGVPEMYVIKKDLWDQYLSNKQHLVQGILRFNYKTMFNHNGIQVDVPSGRNRTLQTITDFISEANILLDNYQFTPVIQNTNNITQNIANSQQRIINSKNINEKNGIDKNNVCTKMKITKRTYGY